MRAVRLAKEVGVLGSGETSASWRLLDNFGCEHVYFLYTTNHGHAVSLGDRN
jgi:hypothetical protein